MGGEKSRGCEDRTDCQEDRGQDVSDKGEETNGQEKSGGEEDHCCTGDDSTGCVVARSTGIIRFEERALLVELCARCTDSAFLNCPSARNQSSWSDPTGHPCSSHSW